MGLLHHVTLQGTWSYSLWLIQYSWKWPRNETGCLCLQSSTCWGLSQILWKNWQDNFWTESIIAHKYLLLCGEIKLYYCINLTSNQNKWWVISTSTCNSVSTLIQNFINLLSLCNSCHGDEKNFQEYVKNLLLGVQHINYIQSDSEHTVISVPNKQVLNNVIDTFKQKSGISFTTYRKPKDFGDRGENI